MTEELARLRWQCRRGMLELDVLLLTYLERQYPGAGAARQQAFRQLLQQPDPLLAEWLLASDAQTPECWRPLVASIRQSAGLFSDTTISE